MKLTLSALMVVLVGWLSPAQGVSSASAPRTLRSDDSQSLRAASPAPAAVAAPSPATVLNKAYKKIRLPEGCNNDSSYDLVIHFHGVPERVISSFEQSKLHAVLVVMNLGAGSGRYENTFAQAGSLGHLLDAIDSVVTENCGKQTRGRVALSSWSAGYGATYRILSHAEDAALVDAVMLADGLHAGFEPNDRRLVNSAQMEPFTKFAQRAAKDEAVMIITHSSIAPPKYASTTQTAAHLVEQLSAKTDHRGAAGPRDMQQISAASMGSFSVRGFAGNGPDAHCDHLYALNELVFAPLQAKWQ
ncbi:MAG: hypothetical protein R3B13_36305 [Polyangiaceae bacterium]